jgi:hypothetical protein
MESLHLEQNDVGAINQLLTGGREADVSIRVFELFVFKNTF